MEIHCTTPGVAVLWLGFFTVKPSPLLFYLANIHNAPNKCCTRACSLMCSWDLSLLTRYWQGRKAGICSEIYPPKASHYKSEVFSAGRTRHTTVPRMADQVPTTTQVPASRDLNRIAERTTCKDICHMSLYMSVHSNAILLLSRADENYPNSGFWGHFSIGTKRLIFGKMLSWEESSSFSQIQRIINISIKYCALMEIRKLI